MARVVIDGRQLELLETVRDEASNAPFSAGYAASVITARWWRSRQPWTKMPSEKAPYKGLGADSEEKHEPVSDIDTVVVDSLKNA